MNYKIVTVDETNLSSYPQLICFINAKHPSHHLKMDWLRQRFAEGMKIKLLYPEGESKAAGFIEYVPGENAWRAVSAAGYMFIHCIWVSSTTWKNKGIGSLLVQDCIQDAEKQGMKGVAVLSSNDAFLARPDLFIKNGFSTISSTPPSYSLLVKSLQDAALPQINNWQQELRQYTGLNIIYSKQCPWVIRFISELDAYLNENGLTANKVELKTPAEAQHAPSPYASFSLINNAKLLADHYISFTRFTNILKKEKLISSKNQA